MAFLLDGKPLGVGVPFTVGDINYSANFLILSTADEKTALGITEVADPIVYDNRFYWNDGTAKALDDVNATDENGNPILGNDGNQLVILGVKSVLKAEEKQTAKSLLDVYDWQVVRKAEKGTALDSAVVTYRDGIRTAYTTRKTEIDNCADTAALVTLYGATEKDGVFTPNMTQYPNDPYRLTV
tara:strand:- start:195 stop:746 length:552 start_codon:yes stop_codon:yes gene_type:complete